MSRFIPNENTFVGYTLGPVGLMAAPSGVTATANAGGGTIPASAQDYVITAYNETGETVGSTVATVTPTAVGTVTLAWTKVPGADGYRIYGRVAGTEKIITQVGDINSWVDTGVIAAGATVPPTVGTASDIESPTVADVNGCVELTAFVSGLNFGSQGNVVPTPNMKKLFETSIAGTSQATATMDMYRDDEIDTAWDLLPQLTRGFIIISRYGQIPNTIGKGCEVWPIRVSSRTNSNMTNNTASMFTTTFAVVDAPAEDAVVVA